MEATTKLQEGPGVGPATADELRESGYDSYRSLAVAGTLYDLAVCVTNHVQSDPDAFCGDPIEPIGGNALGHAANCRLYLRPARGDERIVRLVDAPDRPEGEAVVRIEEGGLAAE